MENSKSQSGGLMLNREVVGIITCTLSTSKCGVIEIMGNKACVTNIETGGNEAYATNIETMEK